MIWDRILFGIRNLQLQEILIRTDSTLQKAIDKGQANGIPKAQLKDVQPREEKKYLIQIIISLTETKNN